MARPKALRENLGPAPWQLALLLAAIALGAYINCFGLGVALDGHVLLSDERVHALTFQNLKLILDKDYWWPAPADRLYRPATTLSFLVNYALFGNGPDPAGYHAVNFLLHLGNVWLVFALARRLLERPWPAFFAAALWAVHPIGTETVANLAGRADLLAAMGVLSGLLAYDRVLRPGIRPLPSLLCLSAAAALAAFSKESGAVLLPLMLLWDLARPRHNGETFARRVPAYLAAAVPLALYLAARARVLDALPWPSLSILDNPLRDAGFWEARWTAVKVAGMGLLLLVCPVSLSSDRSFRQIPVSGIGDPGAWLAFAAIAAILWVAIERRRRDHLWFWCAGFYAVTLLPASNLVVLIGSILAERFLYLPSVAFTLAAAALAYRFLPARYVHAVLAAAIALLAARTLARNPDWDNDLALMSHDARIAPASFRTRELHGELLYDGGGNLDESIREMEAAWEILSPVPAARNIAHVPATLAMLYGIKGDQSGPAGAAQWYGKALSVLTRADQISRAAEREFEVQQALHGKPVTRRRATQDVYLALGVTYHALGHDGEALAAYRYARGIEPSAAQAYDGAIGLSAALGQAGTAALIDLEKGLALGLTPQALAELAQLYAAVPDGACALKKQGQSWTLDQNCPRLRQDLCRASAELAATFAEARRPERERELRHNAATLYGCANP